MIISMVHSDQYMNMDVPMMCIYVHVEKHRAMHTIVVNNYIYEIYLHICIYTYVVIYMDIFYVILLNYIFI